MGLVLRWGREDAPNDGEFVAHSGLLIPLDTVTPYIWPDDPAMVQACLQILPSLQKL